MTSHKLSNDQTEASTIDVELFGIFFFFCYCRNINRRIAIWSQWKRCYKDCSGTKMIWMMILLSQRPQWQQLHLFNCRRKMEFFDNSTYVRISRIFKLETRTTKTQKVKVNSHLARLKSDVAFSSSFHESIYSAQINRDHFPWFTVCALDFFFFFSVLYNCWYSHRCSCTVKSHLRKICPTKP